MTVTAVVCAAFDQATDERIDALRDTVAAAGVRVRRAHRPHLTLAAARVADPVDVVPLIGEIAGRHRPVPLTVTGLDRFPSGVLWLRVDAPDALRALQRDVYSSLISAGFPSAFGEKSDPAYWVPHCTLATRVPGQTLDRLLRKAFDPFPALVEAVSLLLVGGRGDVAAVPLQAERTPNSPSPRHDGDMLDHISVQCADLVASAAFYDAVLAPLGGHRIIEVGDAIGYGTDRPQFWIGEVSTGSGFRESHLAFAAPDRTAVDAFLSAAVAVGAEVLHEARVRPEYHPDYYGAFVRDPDGNNVEAVCHTPA